MEISNIKVESHLFELEPGDMTKYNFIIAKNPHKPELIIAGYGSTRFSGYYYSIDNINTLFKYLPVRNQEYSAWVSDLDISFLGYIESHSNCDKYTAIAAMQCAKSLL